MSIQQINRIGILGGTFDPIHYAHLRLAEEVSEKFDLKKTILVPAGKPIHRSNPLTLPEHRLAMVQMAVEENNKLFADSCEIDRGGTSCSYDSLIEFRRKFSSNPIFFIMGIDAFLKFSTWYKWNELLDLTHLVIAHRAGYSSSLLCKQLSKELLKEYKKRFSPAVEPYTEKPGGHIFSYSFTMIGLSATSIREDIAKQKSVEYLMPKNVIQYIKNHGLYKIPPY